MGDSSELEVTRDSGLAASTSSQAGGSAAGGVVGLGSRPIESEAGLRAATEATEATLVAGEVGWATL